MVSGTTRRYAVPVVFACVGVMGVLAGPASAQSGGLKVTPAMLEKSAHLGNVGRLSLQNTTRETLRVSVRVRPWIQALNGSVTSNPRATYTRYVRATRRSFTIRAGS